MDWPSFIQQTLKLLGSKKLAAIICVTWVLLHIALACPSQFVQLSAFCGNQMYLLDIVGLFSAACLIISLLSSAGRFLKPRIRQIYLKRTAVKEIKSILKTPESDDYKLLMLLYNIAFILILASGILNTIRATNLPFLEPGGVVPYLVIGSWLMLAGLNVVTIWKSLPIVDEKHLKERDVLTDEKLSTLGKMFELTDREMTMIRYLYEGKNNAEIADALGLSENTIKTYNFRLYKKLEVESRVQAVNKIREEIINL